MFRLRRLGVTASSMVLVLLLLLTSTLASASEASEAFTSDEIQLVSSTDSGVIFQVRLQKEHLTIDPLEAGSLNYVRLSVPGWSATAQVGAPEIPARGVLVAVPLGVDIDVDVRPGEARTVVLEEAVLPVATVRANWDPAALAADPSALPSLSREFVADPKAYASGDLFPGALAQVVSDGVMRGQRVVGIAAYPIQYRAATKELTIYDSLEVRLSFQEASANGVASAATRLESAPFEALFRDSVLNAEPARNWRRASESTGSPRAVPWAPPNPGYRVSVEEEGIYQLTWSALRDAGLPVATLDPASFRVYNMGTEVAIYLEGDGDASFEDGESLLFYGQKIQSKYTPYNVYWLTYGQGPGKRMASRSGGPATGTTPSSHRPRQQFEENVYYIPALAGDEDLERYVWDYVNPPGKPSATLTVALPALAPGSHKARLEVSMFGYLDEPINPDHHVRVYLNGTKVDDVKWDGENWYLSSVEVPQSLLNAGSNTIRVECPNDTGVGKDVVYVDWAAIEFASTFTASGGVLAFSYDHAGTWKYQAGGFGTNQVAVFDVTDPAEGERITGASVTGAYMVAFTDSVSSATDYWLADTVAFLKPVNIELDKPSNLASTSNGADHIIVSHPAFGPAVAPLAAHRASHLPGFLVPRVVQVDLQDAYDEFGYGIVGAQAIRDFLGYAYDSWQAPAPAYALLVGDGHYDPKDYGGYGLTSFLPPYLAPVDPELGETAADNRYVSFTPGDNLAEMMVGRLAVNSAAEATTVVQKILDYEQKVAGDWNNRLLFVADNKDSNADYAKLSDNLINCCLPAPYEADKVYLGVTHSTPSAARAAIKAGINAGQLIVNYFGDAGSVAWGEEGFFATSDIPSLANSGRLPVMVVMAPLDGYFHYPFTGSGNGMAESIVRANGKGAVASWSATGFALARGHKDLDRGFFDSVFDGGDAVLGQAAMAGKLRLAATGSNLDLLDTQTLFGDPALSLHGFWEGQSTFLPVIQRSAP